MRMRALLLPGVAAAVVVGLSGCSVPSGGESGILRTATGWSVVVQMCTGHVDGMTVYESRDDADEGILSRDYRAPVTDAVELDLGPGFAETVGTRTGSLYSWSKDDSTSAFGPTFDRSDLERMAAGSVLAPSARRPGHLRATTMNRFRAQADELCD